MNKTFKYKYILLCLSVCLLLGSCVMRPSPTPMPTPEPTPIPTPVRTPVPTTPISTPRPKAGADAEAFIRPIVDEALAALEKVRRDDLSRVTAPFDEAYATYEEIPLTESQQLFFDDVCAIIVESIPEDASAYDKYRYLGYVVSLCDSYDYDGEGLSNTTPYGAIVDGRSICLGYTGAMLHLCRLADLWCAAVTGYASWNGEEHGWNLVMLEEGSYYVDVTWCDQLGVIGHESWNCYFMLTEEKLREDHGIWEGGPASGTVNYN